MEKKEFYGLLAEITGEEQDLFSETTELKGLEG
jgi:hypothetical protein